MNVVETPEPLLDYSRDDSLLKIETFLPVIPSCNCRLRLEQRLWVLCSTLLGARHRRQPRPGLPRESRQALRSSTSLLDTTSVSRTIFSLKFKVRFKVRYVGYGSILTVLLEPVDRIPVLYSFQDHFPLLLAGISYTHNTVKMMSQM